MQSIANRFLHRALPHLTALPAWRSVSRSSFISAAMRGEDPELGEFFDYMEKLKNYEKIGVPKDAGTDSDDGFDLGRMRRLLKRLGDPHCRFRAIHIAGTKGKGSTAAFLSSILREEGYRVGTYSSPHLLTIRERISVGSGKPVSAKVLNIFFHEVKECLDESIQLEKGQLTHFEVFTALAFALFSKENVDIAVIEAGLGGARDATNVLTSNNLAVSVITTIGEEHLAALGGSLESIAMAKAGIIKYGCPLVIGGPFDLHIEQILRNQASSMCSPVVSACDPGVQGIVKGFGPVDGRPCQFCDICIQIKKDLDLSIELSNVKLHMLGHHQLQNAITAVCASLCLQNQGWKISNESIYDGLKNTELPGRSQFLSFKEVGDLGLSRVSVLIDGGPPDAFFIFTIAHTEASAKALADTITMAAKGQRLAFVVAMASDKDHVKFARQLLSGLGPEVVVLTELPVGPIAPLSLVDASAAVDIVCPHEWITA
ncbi:hypothetical protein Taro_052759 [Colocasia esculenta]|uniref:Mur ligase central domain-containing protein n=1 Tax=Colocasia esculenta TaxID=4460 RepID=A0A843XL54_COLES|nr:hypothetical protein [Colocasia esculenta]